MKKIAPILFALSFMFQSCEIRTREKTITPLTEVESKQTDTTSIPSYFESQLRPNEKLQLQQIKTDTVQYIDFNDEGDDFYFAVAKGKDTIGLIFNSHDYNFIRGEQLEIKWIMDSMRYAGDDSFVNYTEFLVSAKKIKNVKLTNKKVKFLWREVIYNDELKMKLNSIMLNEDYIKQISEPEKAALAYIATFVGNECEWDGQANENRSNLKCKILWALNLGYQCSNEHLNLIRYWFRNNKEILKELENCPTTPDGATVQDTFDEITIEVKGNQIIVFFKANGINMREAESWKWEEKHYLEFKENELILTKKEVSPLQHEVLEVRGN